MSETERKRCVGGNTSDEKPSHVRRLNFGRSILTLDVVRQFQGQKDGALVIDRNVTKIPCTSKGEFVRKWIETHRDRVFDSDESSQSSPVLGSFVTNRPEKSPVFGNRRKRPREKASLNNSTIDNTKYMRPNNVQSDVCRTAFNFLPDDCKHAKVTRADKKENLRRNLFNSPVAVHSKASGVSASPILDRNSCSYKRRRRKVKEGTPGRRALDRIDNKYMEGDAKLSPILIKVLDTRRSPILDRNYNSYKRKRRKSRDSLQRTGFAKEENYTDANMNSVIFSDAGEKKLRIMTSQDQRMLLERLENSLQDRILESSSSKESKILEDCVESDSPLSEPKLNIDESLKDVKDIKDVGKIDTESSHADIDNYRDLISTKTDSEKNLSDQIEDVDTQDATPVGEIQNCGLSCNLSYAASKPSSMYSQTSNKDSDKTFFSKVEQFQCTSQKISQISSRVNDLADNGSSQTGIIVSTETSPQRTNAHPSVFLELLNSGKKRKKPKRGSLSEKLQSVISRQISFVRMWRHQLKQAAKDNESPPCIMVYVRSCITRFSRQFLQGVAIEDPFHLLPSNTGNDSSRLLTIITIPDIVGRVEMKSEGVVQIYPPWEILDNTRLTLRATYIHIVSDKRRIGIEEDKVRVDRTERSIVREFDCSCIQANKMLSSCEDRFSKPNVMEKLCTE